MNNRIVKVVQGDITKLKVDAIVNAANNSLLGGGGVDGAIHRAAGPELLVECKSLGGCPTGEARITQGYKLPSRFVIHTVGPVWRGGSSGEEDLLANCYGNSLQLASEKELTSIAFPAISTGAYGFPLEQASVIALREAALFFREQSSMHTIIFVCFAQRDCQVYAERLMAMKNTDFPDDITLLAP
jgi:O-acetyl-ADP-ribose deacetylase (regulator of RNase III)